MRFRIVGHCGAWYAIGRIIGYPKRKILVLRFAIGECGGLILSIYAHDFADGANIVAFV